MRPAGRRGQRPPAGVRRTRRRPPGPTRATSRRRGGSRRGSPWWTVRGGRPAGGGRDRSPAAASVGAAAGFVRPSRRAAAAQRGGPRSAAAPRTPEAATTQVGVQGFRFRLWPAEHHERGGAEVGVPIARLHGARQGCPTPASRRAGADEVARVRGDRPRSRASLAGPSRAVAAAATATPGRSWRWDGRDRSPRSSPLLDLTQRPAEPVLQLPDSNPDRRHIGHNCGHFSPTTPPALVQHLPSSSTSEVNLH